MTDRTPREVARFDDLPMDRVGVHAAGRNCDGQCVVLHVRKAEPTTPSSEATGRAEYVECGIDGCEFTVEAGEGRTMVLHKDDAHWASEATGSGEPPVCPECKNDPWKMRSCGNPWHLPPRPSESKTGSGEPPVCPDCGAVDPPDYSRCAAQTGDQPHSRPSESKPPVPNDVAAWWREKRYSVTDLQRAFRQGADDPLLAHFREWHPDHDLTQCLEVAATPVQQSPEAEGLREAARLLALWVLSGAEQMVIDKQAWTVRALLGEQLAIDHLPFVVQGYQAELARRRLTEEGR